MTINNTTSDFWGYLALSCSELKLPLHVPSSLKVLSLPFPSLSAEFASSWASRQNRSDPDKSSHIDKHDCPPDKKRLLGISDIQHPATKAISQWWLSFLTAGWNWWHTVFASVTVEVLQYRLSDGGKWALKVSIWWIFPLHWPATSQRVVELCRVCFWFVSCPCVGALGDRVRPRKKSLGYK